MSLPRSDGGRRILVAGGTEMNRRLRMSMKVTHELRRRGSKCTVVACGDVPEEFHRVAAPDEVHTQLSEGEVLNLFNSASLLLEATDDPADASAAADLADAVGLPVVSHVGAARSLSLHLVTEWSADAFADLVVNVELRRGIADEAAAAAAARRLAANLE